MNLPEKTLQHRLDESKQLIEKKSKHYPSSTREWNNSIYVYNKNNLSLIPSTFISAMKIIRSFFSAFNKDLEKNIRTKRLLLRLRRLSSNRIYLSNGEFKHRNNNVLVNLYIFNRQKNNYLFKLTNIFLKKNFLRKMNENYIKTLNSIFSKGFESLSEINKDKYLLINILNILKHNKNYKIKTFKKLSNYIDNFYRNILNLTMKKLRLYFFYKQLIFINKSKLNYTYLHLLKKHLETLFNKNVEFSLININRFYLNSDILSESVKLKITRNKRRISFILNRLKDKVKIHKKKIFINYIFKKQVDNKLLLKNSIFNDLKYKHTTGFRLEARGRLTRRYTASRSAFKLKYKGNLLNLDSSFRGISSVILKGNLKSNLQYSKSTSKTRIGSFGIKGWVSGN